MKPKFNYDDLPTFYVSDVDDIPRDATLVLPHTNCEFAIVARNPIKNAVIVIDGLRGIFEAQLELFEARRVIIRFADGTYQKLIYRSA